MVVDKTYCEICNKMVRDWETHRHSSEHQRNLIEKRGIPAEVREANSLK
jgi:hypothetical protein